MQRLDLARRIAARSRANATLVRWARIFSLAFVIVGSLDVISTNAALAVGHEEGNPLVEALQDHMGPWWAVPKMLLHLALAWLILWIPSRRMLRITAFVTSVYLIMVANNFYLATSTL